MVSLLETTLEANIHTKKISEMHSEGAFHIALPQKLHFIFIPIKKGCS